VPLESGSSRETISKNISEMVHAGHPQKQAVAAALNKSREDATVGEFVMIPGKPLPSGKTSNKLRARVTRVLPDGRIEVKIVTPGLYEGGYEIVRLDSIPAGLDEAGNLDRRQSAAELKAVVDALGCAADELCTRFDAYRFRADAARQ
jgi:hypothetical protein